LLPSLLPRMTMTSCLSTLTSVPLYLPNSTQSPILSRARAGPPDYLVSAHGDDFAEGGHFLVQGTNGQYTSYVIDL